MAFYMAGEEWRKSHDSELRLFSNCAKCGKWELKRAMHTMYIRPPYRENPKMLTHICKDCLPDLLDWLGVPQP